ncbi:MAG: VOC family protein [Pseudomonadota bacterium]
MSEDLDVDHALILHDDLGVAVAGLERLGFRPTPPGYHGAVLGTENVTIMLPDRRTYVEVLVVREPTEINAGQRAAFGQRGRHLFGAALKGDARALHARLAPLGIAQGEPFEFKRAVALPQGARDAAFTIAPFRDGALPGLASFVCQHHTPEVVWRDDYLSHENGAQALTALWGVADDPAAVGETLAALYGKPVHSDAQGVTVETGTAAIHYLSPSAWTKRFPGVRLESDAPRILALEFTVHALATYAAQLGVAGVPVGLGEAEIVVPDALGLGVAMVFRAARATPH